MATAGERLPRAIMVCVACLLAILVTLGEIQWPADIPQSRLPAGQARPVMNAVETLTLPQAYSLLQAGEFAVVHERVQYLEHELPEDQNDWNYGNICHQYMTLSGLLAIYEDNDVEKAIGFLQLSSQIKGSPQLNSFGPNMLLAHELLQRGEFNAVKQFLEQCQTWMLESVTLERWIEQVRTGQIPDFGPNLKYH